MLAVYLQIKCLHFFSKMLTDVRIKSNKVKLTSDMRTKSAGNLKRQPTLTLYGQRLITKFGFD